MSPIQHTQSKVVTCEQFKNEESTEQHRLLGVDTNLPSLKCAIFSLLCVCLHFCFCVAAIREHEFLSICIYLAGGHWCKRVVITSVSTRSCYITVIICDVMVCVSVRVCVKSSLLWVLGLRPWESPETIKVKSDSLHFRPLQHETPSHTPLMLYTAEVLVAMVISSPNSVPFHSTPFDEILPILACLCTDVL